MIALSAGHYSKFNDHCDGAHDPHPSATCSAARTCEHAESVRWTNRVAYLVRQQMAVLVVPTMSLPQKALFINTAHQRTPIALAVEIHFNSCGGCNARGSETLYCPPAISKLPGRGKQAAEIVQAFIGRVFDPSRGAKEGWYRQDRPGHMDYPGDVEGDEKPDYFLKATHMPAIIVEPEFIHNRERIDKLFELGTSELASGIVAAAEELTSRSTTVRKTI